MLDPLGIDAEFQVGSPKAERWKNVIEKPMTQSGSRDEQLK